MRDLSPKQIVVRLADRGIYYASESSLYRLLRKHGQTTHRSASRARSRRRPTEKVATGPNQIWSWDITWLPRADGRGHFFLYAVMDVWSRKLVGVSIESRECSNYAVDLIRRTHAREQVNGSLLLHSDNGAPMKSAKLSRELARLGISPSFSRPRVSNDNPFSESLFRSLKYHPGYPRRFRSVEHASQWSRRATAWYNTEHYHSGVRFLTPEQRHNGLEASVLQQRTRVYERARQRHPERWSGSARCWEPVGPVRLHPAA